MSHDDPIRPRVLAIDDSDLVHRLLRARLRHERIDLQVVRTAAEGLRVARETVPDLILLDIQLPEISGLEVTRQLKADDGLKHIPVIAVTAFAMKGDEEKIREGGCEAYIAKPISVSTFMETIQKVLK